MNKKSDDTFLLKSMRHFMLFIFTAILKQAGMINYTFIYNWRKYRSKVKSGSETKLS